jgi:hypothetical protein
MIVGFNGKSALIKQYYGTSVRPDENLSEDPERTNEEWEIIIFRG